MSEYVSLAVQWLSQNPHWAALAVFLINLSESLVGVGLFVPGTLVMFGIGTLVALGAMGLWETLGWAIAGAIVGDGISYMIGRHYRDRLRFWWPFNRHPEWFTRAERFFIRHGGKSVVFGRFAGPVRPIIPSVAGMMGMPPGRFYLVNVISALLWAPAYILPGVALGTSLHLASRVGTRLMLLLVLVLLLAWLIWVLVRRLYALLQPRAERMLLRMLSWGSAHPRFRGITSGLLEPHHPEVKALVELGAALVIGGGLFFSFLLGQIGHPSPYSMDYQVYTLFQGLRTPWADHLMVAIAALGDAPANLAVILGVLGFLVARQRWLAAGHWLAAVGLAALLGWGLNHLLPLSVPRPELDMGGLSLAFPSTHALVVSALYGFLAALLARELPPGLRRLPYSLVGVWVGMVALSHLYLGRHWVSDVLGGIALGVAWAGLVGIAYRRHAHQPIGAVGLTLVLGVAVALVGGWQASLRHQADLERYAVRYTDQVLDEVAWWEGTDWVRLPAYRVDWEGDSGAPMSLQYAGDPDMLRRQLEPLGWRDPPPLEMNAMLLWFTPHPNLAELPVLPQVHDGRHEVLRLMRCVPGAPGRLVLRLYPADARLTGNGPALWVGTVTRERVAETLGLLTLARRDKEYDTPLAVLERDLASLEQRRVRRPGPYPAGWRGDMLLVRDSDQAAASP